MLSHHVIFHGRRICHARKPACGACPIAPLCPAYGEGETDPEKAKKLLKYEKGGFPGQRLKPPQAYLDAGGKPAPPWGPGEAPARTRAAPGEGTVSGRPYAGTPARGTCGTIEGPAGVGTGRTGVAMTHASNTDRMSGTDGGRLNTEGLPDWLDPVLRVVQTVEPLQLSRFLPPTDGGAASAVLILFGEASAARAAADGACRLAALARRPARVPGGALDPRTATRGPRGRCGGAARGRRETGLDPGGVQLFGVLPKLYIPVSSFW